MSIPDVTILTPLVALFLEGTHLTRAERAEVMHIAQGFHSKDSAVSAGRSNETIRARRKKIYKKLGVSGSAEVISALLALSLQMLAKMGHIASQPVATTQPGQGITAPAIHLGAAG